MNLVVRTVVLFAVTFVFMAGATADAEILGGTRCDTAWSAERFFDCIAPYATMNTKIGRELIEAIGRLALVCEKETGAATRRCVGERLRDVAVEVTRNATRAAPQPVAPPGAQAQEAPVSNCFQLGQQLIRALKQNPGTDPATLAMAFRQGMESFECAPAAPPPQQTTCLPYAGGFTCTTR